MKQLVISRVLVCFFSLFILMVQSGFSQDIADFERLKSKGTIPKRVTSSSAKKYKVLETTIERVKESRKKQKDKRKFLLESTYVIDEMMKNGLIIFNDPASEYVTKVANELLKDKPKIKEKVSFYTVRSAEVNAFATDRGDIFINLGLLAKLETEAQLAFIMAHEIIHVIERHNMDVFLEYEDINSANGQFKKQNDFQKLLKKSNYSKRIEKEADEEGLELFLESSYGTSSLKGVFDILATAHTPYINEVFDISYLNVGGVVFHDSLLLDSTNSIVFYEEDEKLSTHPGIKKRREKLSEVIGIEKEIVGKKDFIIGENEFLRIKELAQFEICNILIENLSYLDALYYSYVLSKKYPNHKFLKRIKLKSLYGLSKYTTKYDKNSFLKDPDDIQGEIQQVYHLFYNSINDIELMSLTAAHLWEYHQENPNDEGMEMRLESIISEIRGLDEDEIGELTSDEGGGTSITKGIFKEYHQLSTFKELLNRKQKDEEEIDISVKKIEKGYTLGLDKIVFVNPDFLKINLKKKKQPIQFIESENRQDEMIEMIKENGKRLGIKTNFMDVNSLRKNAAAEKFNNIITLERWAMQKISLPNGMVPDNYNEAKKIIDSNKIKHVAFMGALSLKSRKSLVRTPNLLYNLSTPNVKSFFYTIVIDAEKQNVVMFSYNVMSQKDKKGIMNANLYWLMLQMKKKPN